MRSNSLFEHCESRSSCFQCPNLCSIQTVRIETTRNHCCRPIRYRSPPTVLIPPRPHRCSNTDHPSSPSAFEDSSDSLMWPAACPSLAEPSQPTGDRRCRQWALNRCESVPRLVEGEEDVEAEIFLRGCSASMLALWFSTYNRPTAALEYAPANAWM